MNRIVNNNCNILKLEIDMRTCVPQSYFLLFDKSIYCSYVSVNIYILNLFLNYCRNQPKNCSVLYCLLRKDVIFLKLIGPSHIIDIDLGFEIIRNFKSPDARHIDFVLCNEMRQCFMVN